MFPQDALFVRKCVRGKVLVVFIVEVESFAHEVEAVEVVQSLHIDEEPATIRCCALDMCRCQPAAETLLKRYHGRMI